MKIKITKEDKKFSEITRRKAKGVCEYCNKWFGWKHLQTSHFKGRRNKAVRWYPDNVSAICFTCHNTLGENPDLHLEWFKKRLGNRFNALVLKANLEGAPDMWALNRWLDEELKRVRTEWDEPEGGEPSLGNQDWINAQYYAWIKTPHKKNMSFAEWLGRKLEERT